MKYLVIVDMQNDFIIEQLGTQAAKDVSECIAYDAIQELVDEHTAVFCTMDTHFEDYLETMEEKKLPTPHCIFDTPGWHLDEGIRKAVWNSDAYLPNVPGFCNYGLVCKSTFGSVDLVNCIDLLSEDDESFYPEEITLIGVCTDICVISNAMILKASFPEVPIRVISHYCAGTTKENHLNALKAMEQCHIEVI